MPVMKCKTKDGRPGWKYGATGKCYGFKPGDKASEARAKAKAKKQGRAIEWRKHAQLSAELIEEI